MRSLSREACLYPTPLFNSFVAEATLCEWCKFLSWVCLIVPETTLHILHAHQENHHTCHGETIDPLVLHA